MRTPRPVVVDFETDPIAPRPNYPPPPIGVSIRYPGKPARYYGFGHVPCTHCGSKARNDSTEAQAKAALKAAYAWAKRTKQGLLYQNGKFDTDVAEVHWGLPVPDWSLVHDTMFLIFLDDPNQRTFSLKPASERILGMKPEEKDAVGEWLVEHQPLRHKGVRISLAASSDHYFMKYLRYAPAPLVGRYANGDVVRTDRLFAKLWPKTFRRKMLPAYDRERRLMPVLLEMERRGIPVHLKRLKADVGFGAATMARLASWVRSKLKCSNEVNLDSGDQLFEAMRKAKVVDLKKAPLTKTGKHQTNKAALLVAVKDRQLVAVLKYRAQLKTCLNNFMVPWTKTAEDGLAAGKVSKAMKAQGKSLIYASWNQVKGDARGGSVGARTGRLSATPAFMAIPKTFEPIFKHEEKDRRKAKALPRCPLSLPPLPKVRSYVAPFPGDELIDRDWSQQEPRILAHFDGGAILKLYQDDPWMDFHDKVRSELARAGLHYERKPVKNTGLGLIYGMGVGLLAERTGLTVDEARRLKEAILRILVGLKKLYQDCKVRAIEGRPIRTWGGREYHCEPPAIVDGKFRTFEYKLPNGLIQGSGADAMKEAILRYVAAKGKDDKLLLNVHDQLTASVPRAKAVAAMRTLRLAMESLEFDVKMLTEGSSSEESWGALQDTDKRGEARSKRWEPAMREAS